MYLYKSQLKLRMTQIHTVSYHTSVLHECKSLIQKTRMPWGGERWLTDYYLPTYIFATSVALSYWGKLVMQGRHVDTRTQSRSNNLKVSA